MSEATEQVISGLEGVLACESSIAYIDGSIPELSFRGYDIHDIAQTLTFEQVTFLIWHDRIPQADELRRGVELGSLRLSVDVRAGISEWREPRAPVEDLLRQADVALLQAKEESTVGVVYQPSHDAEHRLVGEAMPLMNFFQSHASSNASRPATRRRRDAPSEALTTISNN